MYGKSLSFGSAMFHVLYCKIYRMSMMSGSVIVLFCTCQIYGVLVKQETKRNETAKRPETGSHTQNIDSDCTWLQRSLYLESSFKFERSTKA